MSHDIHFQAKNITTMRLYYPLLLHNIIEINFWRYYRLILTTLCNLFTLTFDLLWRKFEPFHKKNFLAIKMRLQSPSCSSEIFKFLAVNKVHIVPLEQTQINIFSNVNSRIHSLSLSFSLSIEYSTICKIKICIYAIVVLLPVCW